MREIKFRNYFVNFKRYMTEDERVEHLMDITNGKIVCNIDELECNGDTLDYYNGGSILEQYTGLKDKNGVEIYRADLLKDEYGCIFEAVEDEREACTGYRIKLIKKEKINQNHLEIGLCYDFHSWYYPENKLEVIGNIHENNELLKDK